MELIETRPDISVLESEYKRLLGLPAQYQMEGRVRELATWAKRWYAEHGRPWVYARQVALTQSGQGFQINGAAFGPNRLHEQLSQAQAHAVLLAAVSAGPECETEAKRLWEEGKPDEYFFLEIYGSAVVEHLVTSTGARLCAWADSQGMTVLPHYSPGYSGWEVSDQTRLFEAICHQNGKSFPGDIKVLASGMLQPKKSLLAVFGITRHMDRVRGLAGLVPCENCSYPNCQYRRAPYGHALAQIEDVRRLQPRSVDGNASSRSASGLDQDAKYSINSKALRKWSEERLQLSFADDRSVQARFRYEGTTCSNLGRQLEFDYRVELTSSRDGYRITGAHCSPAPGDSGHKAMCEYLTNAETLMTSIGAEQPMIGRPLNDVLAWGRRYSPAGCYCDADSRLHKWGLVFEVIHYALVQREKGSNQALETPIPKSQLTHHD